MCMCMKGGARENIELVSRADVVSRQIYLYLLEHERPRYSTLTKASKQASVRRATVAQNQGRSNFEFFHGGKVIAVRRRRRRRRRREG